MFRALFDAMPHVTWLYGEAHGRPVYVNVAFERVFGLPRVAAEADPPAWLDAVHEGDREVTRAALVGRRAGVAPQPLADFRIRRPGGEVRWLRSSIRQVEAEVEAGRPGVFWIETALDVTAEREAAARAQHDREILDRVVGLLRAIVVLADPSFRITWWNSAFAELVGPDVERVRGCDIASIVCPDLGDGTPEERLAACSAKGDSEHVHSYVTATGEPREVEWRPAPLYDPTGNVTGILAVGRDVTVKMKERRARRMAEERLGEFVRNLPDVPWLYDVVSGEFVALGHDDGQVWGRPRPPGPDSVLKMLEWVHPDDRLATRETVTRLLSGAATEALSLEYRLLRPDGEIRWVLARGTPVRDERGRVIEIAGYSADVTESRATAHALRESEARFRRMSETIQEVFFLISADHTKLHYVNPAFERVWGFSCEELYANPRLFLSSIHPEDRPRLAALRPATGVLPAELKIEYRIVRPDGGIRWVATHTYLVAEDDAPERRLVGVATDITDRREAERALRESEERFRCMSETMGEVFFLVSGDRSRMYYVNPAVERIFGVPCSAIYENPRYFLDLVHPEDREKMIRSVAARRGTASETSDEYRIIRPDGSIRWISARLYPIAEPDGSVQRVVGLLADVTDHKESERALKESEERLRRMSETMQDVFLLVSADRKRLYYINPAWERVFGVPIAAIYDNPRLFLELMHPEDRAAVVKVIADQRSRGSAPESYVEYRIVRPDGAIRWIGSRSYPIDEPGGAEPRVVALLTDITDRKETERALRESEERFRRMGETMQEAFFLVSADRTRLYYMNPAWERLHGVPLAALFANPRLFLELVHPDDRDRLVKMIADQRSAASAETHLEYRIVRPDGAVRWVASRTYPTDDPEGSERRVVGLLTDITERKKAEQALRESEERFRRMSETMGEVFYLIAADLSRLYYINPAFERVFGLPCSALYERPRAYLDVIHPEDREAVTRGADARARGAVDATDIEYRIIRPDGTMRWVAVRTYPVVEPNGGVGRLVGLVSDITDRREAERALRESEERFRRMSETMEEVFFLVSVDRTRLHYINPAFERVFGIPRAVLYEDTRRFLATIHPEDRVILARASAAQRASRSVADTSLEYRIIRPDGSVRWIASRTYPVAEPGGDVQQVVGLLTDITDRKAAEQALRERTVELERLLREKDVLLAEVHHRVKNNLQRISGLMHMMAAKAHGRPIRETVDELERRIQAMALIHETLYRSSNLAAVDMQVYLDRIAQAQLGAAEGSHRSIAIQVQAPGVTMDLDGALRCGLIVSELASNSLKHAFGRRRRGRVDITMERAAGGRLALRVSDDGGRLPAEIDFGSEATLGLRLVNGIAEQLGGAARRVPGPTSAIEIVFPESA